jgi:hypothetical protein
MGDDIRALPEGVTVRWTQQEEELLASWAERAAGYRWLHDKTSKHYDSWNRMLEIPVSILSYLSGGAVLSGSMNEGAGRYFIGTISILGGVLTNVQTALRWKELAEKHRLVGNLFSAYYRNITAELSLDPGLRVNPLEYIRLKRTEFDRLIEQSPVIPHNIIVEFNAQFKDVKMAKPEITNGIHPVLVFRGSPRIRPVDVPKDSVVIRVNGTPLAQNTAFSLQAPPAPDVTPQDATNGSSRRQSQREYHAENDGTDRTA